MSNVIDDKELDDYLSGDTQYSQRYRAIPTDDVPTELDQLVLAQANATNVAPIVVAAEKRTARRKSRSFWMRVSAPVAVAASFILVVMIVIDSGVRYDSAPATTSLRKDSANAPAQQTARLEQYPASQIPTPALVADAKKTEAEDSLTTVTTELSRAKADAAAAQSSQAKLKASANALKVEAAAKQARVAAAEVSAVGNVQAPSPAVAAGPPPPAAERQQSVGVAADKRSEIQRSSGATELEEAIVTGQLRREQIGNSGAGPRGTIPASSFEEHEPSDAELAKLDREASPSTWLTYIRELRVNGKSSAANREWKRFAKAYPAYFVDAADSARPKK